MSAIDEDREREKEDKSTKKSSTSGPSTTTKTKDLSHVPCKFYKVGSCTAGSSCPFSHSGITGPGAQKDVCAWFVKGNNCKFGHKCALAHVLPGQSMSMDRKNKKLAQQQAQAGKEGKEGKEGREGKGRRRDTQQARPTTLSLKSLKASISPSAPAPALDDTDFTSFSALEPDKLTTAPAVNGKLQQQQSKPNALDMAPSSPPKRDFGPIGSPPKNTEAVSASPGTPTNKILSSSPYKHSMLRSSSGLGASGISGTARTGLSMNRSTSTGNSTGLTLGSGIPGGKNPSWGSMGNGSDIGSLPSLPSALLRPLNGIQPHTPLTPNSSTTQQNIKDQVNKDSVRKDFDLTFEYDELYSNSRGRATPGRGASSFSEVIIEDDLDNLDEFLPSSLTDLLTPEERKRRLSRGNSSSHQDTHSGLTSPHSYSSRRTLGVPLASRVEGNSTSGGSTPGHRYSRSVPMGDMSHLWASQDQNPVPSPGANTTTVSSSFTGPSSLSANGIGLPSSPPRRIGNGTPGSFTSASGRLAADDYYPYTGGSGSPGSAALGSIGSMGGMGGLNPSNASAAFLPGYGFGTAYIKAKREREAAVAAANLVGAAQRSVSGGILTNSRMAAGAGIPGTSPGGTGMAYGTPRKEPTGLASAAAFSVSGVGASRDLNGIGNMGLGGLGLGALNNMETAVSPSTRAALQNHAPGQSLPQGLAAGLSRIHAKTSMQVGSLSSVGSPPAGSVAVSPGVAALGFYSGPYGTNRMPSQQSQPQIPPGLGLGPGSGPGYYGTYQQTAPMQTQSQGQLHAQYNALSPTYNSNLQTSDAGTTGPSDLDVMFSKFASNPQAPALQTPTQASAPLSYAGAAATTSSNSRTQPKSIATGASRDNSDDLFDMDEA
ncbi:hypothetical protein DFH05DRAFT_1458849 [Lentinula detonsa]|uniref:C3H1-type domain-containing protein n=1 Tax=Lentinula detonsa TaxID=2804962 RepID=A0A9W8P4L0_9AGAR|nr:hypothetical protein DFH05DRAFT_1458849 [Lentinula detonsa]